MKLPRWAAVPLWMMCLGTSAWITCHFAFDYTQAILGRVGAQWQFEFLLAPIPILAALLSFAFCFLANPKLGKPFMILSLAGVIVPAVLSLLVIFRIY